MKSVILQLRNPLGRTTLCHWREGSKWANIYSIYLRIYIYMYIYICTIVYNIKYMCVNTHVMYMMCIYINLQKLTSTCNEFGSAYSAFSNGFQISCQFSGEYEKWFLDLIIIDEWLRNFACFHQWKLHLISYHQISQIFTNNIQITTSSTYRHTMACCCSSCPLPGFWVGKATSRSPGRLVETGFGRERRDLRGSPLTQAWVYGLICALVAFMGSNLDQQQLWNNNKLSFVVCFAKRKQFEGHPVHKLDIAFRGHCFEESLFARTLMIEPNGQTSHVDCWFFRNHLVDGVLKSGEVAQHHALYLHTVSSGSSHDIKTKASELSGGSPLNRWHNPPPTRAPYWQNLQASCDVQKGFFGPTVCGMEIIEVINLY